jgi:uncharacterized protein YjiS (DUF1127 family)
MRFSHGCWPFWREPCPDFAFIALHISIRAQDEGSVPTGDAAALFEPRDFTLETTPMILTHILARIQSWLRYRRNVEILSQLSDRELADIGLNRGSIEQAARQAIGA